MKRVGTLSSLVTALLMFLGSGAGLAQTYPGKPVKVVVGFAAGGGTDIIARVVSQKLGENLGQQFVVDNRPGGGTTVGSIMVAKSPPDGYTLLAVSSSYATSASLYGNLAFDPQKDLVPVVEICIIPFAIVSHPSFAAKSVVELIALAKSTPGKLNYASSGVGGQGHLGGELFKSMANIDIVHIPYKGGAPALTDVVGGRVPLAVIDLTSSLQYLNAGQLRMLAVTSEKRAKALPNAPAINESGLPGYSFSTWVGLMAPANTPQDVVQKLNAEVNKVITMPDVEQRFAAQAAESVGGTPEQFAALIQSEISRWTKVVRDGNIRVE